MTEDELKAIAAGLRGAGTDDQYVEAKRSQSALPKSVRRTLSSFSNQTGGVIVLGLDEENGFAATGVDDATGIAAILGNVCSVEIEPPLRPLIEIHEFEGKHVVTAEVPELLAAQKPAYIKAAGLVKGSYIRVGDSDRQLTSYEVQLMLESRGQPRHDSEAVPGTSLNDLDSTLLDAYLKRLDVARPRIAILPKDEKLEVLGVVRGGELTLAGLLALGSFPQKYFPQLGVTFVRYPDPAGPGVGEERFLDSAAVEGPITAMVNDLQAILRKNMTRRAVVSGVGRRDLWEYPEAALREAIVNALAHRDLSPQARGTQVQVEMYPDRVSVKSPGGLFGPVTLDSLGEGVSSSRNATLLRILEDVPVPGEDVAVCENRGSGIPAMLAALRGAGLSPPAFSDTVSGFRVEFPNHSLLGEDVLAWVASLGQEGLTESQVIGLAMLRSGETLDNPKYRAATGVDSRDATSELQDLVARELVTQLGAKRWSRYELADLTARPRDPQSGRMKPSDRRQQVISAIGSETLSRREIAERTGLSDRAARHWLKVLSDEGMVVRTTPLTQSVHARYRVTVPPGQRSLFDLPDVEG